MTSTRRSRCRAAPGGCAVSASLARGMHVFSRTEDTSLTPEQTKALVRYRARWTAIRRSTEAADRGAAEEGVRLAYRAAGLSPPARFLWCEGPVAMSRRASRILREDGPNVRWALLDWLRWKVAGEVRRRLPRRLLRDVETVVNPADA